MVVCHGVHAQQPETENPLDLMWEPLRRTRPEHKSNLLEFCRVRLGFYYLMPNGEDIVFDEKKTHL